MAVNANTVLTYDIEGKREDLTDMISDISPDETPVYSRINKNGKAKNTLHEWQTDELEDASESNAQLEGDDAAFEAEGTTTRVGNYTQIMRKTVIVSDTEEAVDKAGRKSELAYKIARKGRVLKMDIEKNLLANIGGVGGDEATARKFASLGAWVKTNVDKEATGVNPAWTSGVPLAGRTDSAAPRAFTEDMVKSIMQLCYENGAKPSTLSVGAHNKVVASAFAGVAPQQYVLNAAKPGVVVGSVDVYVSDFGKVTIEPNRLQRPRDAWFLDHSFLQIAWLRRFAPKKLAKTGDNTKYMVVGELTLVVKNEKALGLAADLLSA